MTKIGSTVDNLSNFKHRSNLMENKNYLKALICERLFYISHPSISNLECTINLKTITVDEFQLTVQQIILLGNFNLTQIIVKDKLMTITFKDVAAIKLLNIIFKDNDYHPLYPIYKKWIDGSEWISKVF